MLYRQFKDDKLSLLGYGCMRLPVIDNDQANIDEERVTKLLDHALESGINYFDTAYSYHLKQSEIVVGKVLGRHPRDSYFLASKFPGHEKRSHYDVEAIFNEQLEKCGADYFDYYLLHNVCEYSIETYLDDRWGIVEYLCEQRDKGRIRHFGFSAHGRLEVIERFLNRFGDKVEFTQIQLNYLDWILQDAKATVELLRAHNLPIWVMEPVRGGALANLSDEATARLKALRPNASAASWAFRWLQGIDGVQMILSGMSNEEQLEDNLNTFSDEQPLSPDEVQTLDEIARSMLTMVPCTSCRYCTRVCPKGLDIPAFMFRYNDALFKPDFRQSTHIESLPDDKKPSACIKCRKCVEACPQGIDIPEALADLQRLTDTLPRWADLRKYD